MLDLIGDTEFHQIFDEVSNECYEVVIAIVCFDVSKSIILSGRWRMPLVRVITTSSVGNVESSEVRMILLMYSLEVRADVAVPKLSTRNHSQPRRVVVRKPKCVLSNLCIVNRYPLRLTLNVPKVKQSVSNCKFEILFHSFRYYWEIVLKNAYKDCAYRLSPFEIASLGLP